MGTRWWTREDKGIIAEFQPIVANADTCSFRELFRRSLTLAHLYDRFDIDIVKIMLEK